MFLQRPWWLTEHAAVKVGKIYFYFSIILFVLHCHLFLIFSSCFRLVLLTHFLSYRKGKLENVSGCLPVQDIILHLFYYCFNIISLLLLHYLFSFLLLLRVLSSFPFAEYFCKPHFKKLLTYSLVFSLPL